MPLHQPKRHTFATTAPIAPEFAGMGTRNLPLRLFGTADESIVDGPGLRYVVFVQGCPHHCPGCHNPGSHDPAGGTPSDTNAVWAEIARRPHLDGVTFSGGEPFAQADALAELGARARARGMTVMTYSGYTYDRLLEMAKTDPGTHRLLTVTNILVDGPFILAERDLTLRFRGSRNQRLLDITAYPNATAAVEARI